ncbi:MAG: cyclase family protein [Oscillospiraceae bacterium]|nr:cyclase family protein [Oscillospiraceae bacterium]
MIHDLTITLSEKTLPFLPANDPYMKWEHLASHDKHQLQVSHVSMSAHMGTHIDTPLHFIDGGKTTAQIDLSKYCGQAVCLDVPNVRTDEVLDFSKIMETNKYLIKPGDIVIFRTGWEEMVGTPEYFEYPDFHPDTGALLTKFGINGIGFDLPSIDHDGSVHRDILSRDIGIIESLINLKPLIGKRFYFSAVPLKFENGDGSPVRAYAVTDYY